MQLLETAAPSHVAAVRRNFVEAIGDADYAALGRAFDAVLAVDPAACRRPRTLTNSGARTQVRAHPCRGALASNPIMVTSIALPCPGR